MAQRPPRAETRQRLVDAAASVFAKHGVDGTSLEQVAEAAGLTKGAIYSNFSSKEALVFAVIDEHGTWIDPSPLFDPELDTAEQLRELGRSAARLTRGTGKRLVQLDRAIQAYLLNHPPAMKRYRSSLREMASTGGAVLDAVAQEQGRRLPLPGVEFVHVLMALTRGMTEAALQDPGLFDDEDFGNAFALLAGPPPDRQAMEQGRQ